MNRNLDLEQNYVYRKIIDNIALRRPKCFFLSGLAGSGKTYLLNKIAAYCEQENIHYVSLAYTGVAASFLTRGSTVHSFFQLQWNRCPFSVKGRNKFRGIEVILWDQAEALGKDYFEAIDLMFKDLMGKDSLFGGKIVIIAGDFCGCLPIVGGKSVHSESLHFSRICRKLECFRLETNFRHGNHFEWIADIGLGHLSEVRVPEDCRVQDRQELIRNIFGNLKNKSEIEKRVILTVYNRDVKDINLACLDQLSRLSRHKIKTIKGLNYFQESDEKKGRREYNKEILMHEKQSVYYPPNVLELSAGCPIILTERYKKLPKGTRLIFQSASRRVIKAVIFNDDSNNPVVIKRIEARFQVKNSNREFIRKQFPVDLCFAQTINKVQGAEFNKVGLYLPRPVFSHGQLYVALSRTSRIPENLKILMDKPDGCMQNVVVFKDFEALNSCFSFIH